jgi:hypothetical protein
MKLMEGPEKRKDILESTAQNKNSLFVVNRYGCTNSFAEERGKPWPSNRQTLSMG